MAIRHGGNTRSRLFGREWSVARDGERCFGTEDSDFAIASWRKAVPTKISLRKFRSQGCRTCLCRGCGNPCTRKIVPQFQLPLRQPHTRFRRPYTTYTKLASLQLAILNDSLDGSMEMATGDGLEDRTSGRRGHSRSRDFLSRNHRNVDRGRHDADEEKSADQHDERVLATKPL